MKVYATDPRYAVDIMVIDHDETFVANAVSCDGDSYGMDSFWFNIGYFKSLKAAQKSAIRQMAAHNLEVKF